MSLLAENAGELSAETVPLLQQPGAFAQELFPFGVGSLEPASSEASEARWLAGICAAADLPVACRSRWIWSRMSGCEYSQDRDTRPSRPRRRR